MKYILVLGSDANNRGDMFGGIFDYSRTPKTENEIALHDAISKALSEPWPANFGMGEGPSGIGEDSLYESMPFEGKIEATISLYIED